MPVGNLQQRIVRRYLNYCINARQTDGKTSVYLKFKLFSAGVHINEQTTVCYTDRLIKGRK